MEDTSANKEACWVAGPASAEVGRQLIERTLGGVPVVFYRSESGRPVALHGVCPHQPFPLVKGTLVGDNIKCGYHGLVVGGAGNCVHVPWYEPARREYRVKTYVVVERGGRVWIWMSSRQAADDAEFRSECVRIPAP